MAKMHPVLFFRQVRQEIGKVVWPTRKETMMSSLMVIIFTVRHGNIGSVTQFYGGVMRR